jgi:hypothetical protein
MAHRRVLMLKCRLAPIGNETSLPGIQLIEFAQQYWLRFAQTAGNLFKLVLSYSTPISSLTDGAIAPRDRSGFVAIELKQLRQRSSQGFGCTFGLLRWHRRRGVDAFWQDGWRSARQNRFKVSYFFGQKAKTLRGVECPKRG